MHSVINRLAIAAVVLTSSMALAQTPAQSQSIQKSAALTSSTNAPSAKGSVALSYSLAKGKTNESFKVTVIGSAETNAVLQVNVTMDGGTTVSAGAILTNRRGNGSLAYSTKPPRRSSIQTLPSDLEPVSQITHVDVLDANSNLILSGDITAAGTKFLMTGRTRLIDPDGIRPNGAATISAKSGTNSRQTMGFTASRLPTNSTVQIQVNGQTIASPTLRRSGRLSARFALPSTIDPALITSIQILDTSNNVLLSATLPQ